MFYKLKPNQDGFYDFVELIQATGTKIGEMMFDDEIRSTQYIANHYSYRIIFNVKTREYISLEKY